MNLKEEGVISWSKVYTTISGKFFCREVAVAWVAVTKISMTAMRGIREMTCADAVCRLRALTVRSRLQPET